MAYLSQHVSIYLHKPEMSAVQNSIFGVVNSLTVKDHWLESLGAQWRPKKGTRTSKNFVDRNSEFVISFLNYHCEVKTIWRKFEPLRLPSSGLQIFQKANISIYSVKVNFLSNTFFQWFPFSRKSLIDFNSLY